MSYYNLPYSISQEDLENTIMTALEKQFQETRCRINPALNVLHKQTEYVLGIYYREIAKRKGQSEKAALLSQNKREL